MASHLARCVATCLALFLLRDLSTDATRSFLYTSSSIFGTEQDR